MGDFLVFLFFTSCRGSLGLLLQKNKPINLCISRTTFCTFTRDYLQLFLLCQLSCLFFSLYMYNTVNMHSIYSLTTYIYSQVEISIYVYL